MTGIYPGTMLIQTERTGFTSGEKVLAGSSSFWSESIFAIWRLDAEKPLLKRQAGTSVSLKDRRAAPALGSRLLRSYVPLRCGPNASGSARDTEVPVHVSQSDFSISSYITKTDLTPRALLWVPKV